MIRQMLANSAHWRTVGPLEPSKRKAIELSAVFYFSMMAPVGQRGHCKVPVA